MIELSSSPKLFNPRFRFPCHLYSRSFGHGTGEASLAGSGDGRVEQLGVRTEPVPGLWE